LFGIISVTAVPAAADSITLYQNDNYRGRQFTADRQVTNFDQTGFNDRAHSAVVHDGRWEICMDADFSGGCSVLAPGAYPNLGAYAGRISSVRPADGRYSRSGRTLFQLFRQSLRRPRPKPGSTRDALRRPESVWAFLPDLRHDAEPEHDRIQRPCVIAACPKRLLDLLQRFRIPG
jgi:hypothetical protein